MNLIYSSKLLSAKELSGKTPFLLFCLSLVIFFQSSHASENLEAVPVHPTAEQIMARAIKRAEWSEKEGLAQAYTYLRKTIVEEYSSKGQLRERKEKLFQVVPFKGGTYSRLLLINGKPLSEAELRGEADREKEALANLAKGKKSKRDVSLNEELVRRFTYELLGTEEVDGRPAYSLAFRPARGARDSDDLVDKILSRTGGVLWVDTEDYEIARIDLRLLEKVSIGWGGMLASVQTLNLSVDRVRLNDGVWLVNRTEGSLEGRQFLTRRSFRNVEISSDFVEVASRPSAGYVPLATAGVPFHTK
jgi:hypothetical protein